MNGVVFGDADGIAFTGGGTLVVENSVIAGFMTNGINQSAAGSNLMVNNCEFRNNSSALKNGSGSNTNSNTVIENSRFESNVMGVESTSGAANLTLRNSVVANNSNTGVLASSILQAQPVLIVVDTCTIAHNPRGVETGTAASGSAVVRVTNSTIYHNGLGMNFNGTGAAIESYGNNRVTANASNSTFSGTVLPLQ